MTECVERGEVDALVVVRGAVNRTREEHRLRTSTATSSENSTCRARVMRASVHRHLGNSSLPQKRDSSRRTTAESSPRCFDRAGATVPGTGGADRPSISRGGPGDVPTHAVLGAVLATLFGDVARGRSAPATAHASATPRGLVVGGSRFFPVMLIDQCTASGVKNGKALGINVVVNENCPGVTPHDQLGLLHGRCACCAADRRTSALAA